MINKMNKKGIAPMLVVAIVVATLVFISGSIVAFKLSSIPVFVWVGLGIFLIFKLIGSDKK